MTRHGMIQLQAAGAVPPVTDERESMVAIAASRIATSRVQGRLNRAKVRQRGLSASTSALPRTSRAIADIGRKSKSP